MSDQRSEESFEERRAGEMFCSIHVFVWGDVLFSILEYIRCVLFYSIIPFYSIPFYSLQYFILFHSLLFCSFYSIFFGSYSDSKYRTPQNDRKVKPNPEMLATCFEKFCLTLFWDESDGPQSGRWMMGNDGEWISITFHNQQLLMLLAHQDFVMRMPTLSRTEGSAGRKLDCSSPLCFILKHNIPSGELT